MNTATYSENVDVSQKKEQALVICPGRGTYNKEELGYLRRYHSDKPALIEAIDHYRRRQQQTPVSALDGQDAYVLREHSRGDNASPLIWACAYADFLSINRERFEIAAITGNSMGWYIALGAGGGLSEENALHVINSMGTRMQASLLGGQLIYPLVDEQWQAIPGRRTHLMEIMAGINAQPACTLAVSIELGGMLVFGGNEAGLKRLAEQLPPEQGRFPMRLYNHAAFHTELQRPISDAALQALDPGLFQHPAIPLIDGRGQAWTPYATDPAALHRYTLDHQVCACYDFTRAVQVAVREYAPDRIIILGPGTTLGGAVAQSLIGIGWKGWHCKEDFIQAQKRDPYILSLGMESQRALVTAP